MTYVDQPVTLRPLDAVRSASRRAARASRASTRSSGATITTDLQAGTFTFTAARAGQLLRAVPRHRAAAAGHGAGAHRRARVAARRRSRRSRCATRRSCPPGGEVTVDPLENDSDPAGKRARAPVGRGPGRLRPAASRSSSTTWCRSGRTRTLDAPGRAPVHGVQRAATARSGEIVVHPVPPSATHAAARRAERRGQRPDRRRRDDPRARGRVRPRRRPPHAAARARRAARRGPGPAVRLRATCCATRRPPRPVTARATFAVQDATGNVTAATVTVRVHESDASTKAPPRPRDLVARVFEGDTVRIPVPLVGIDPDGDGVTLLGPGVGARPGPHHRRRAGLARVRGAAGRARAPTRSPTRSRTGWASARSRRSGSASARGPPARRPSWRATTRSPCAPASAVEVRVLANDVDSSGGELSLGRPSSSPQGIDAEIQGRRIVVQAPDAPTVLQIAYTATNDRGGRDTAVLTVTVVDDAPVLPPIARDVVVPALDTIDRTEVSVDVLAVAQNPSGPLSDLAVSVPGVAGGRRPGDRARQRRRHARRPRPDGAVPADQHATARRHRVVVRVHHRARPRLLPADPAAQGTRAARRLGGAAASSRSASRSRWPRAARRRIADPLGVTAVRSDGSPTPVMDAQTLQFTSAPGYAGPASITVPVTDSSGAGRHDRADVGHHPADHRVRGRRPPADVRPVGHRRRARGGAARGRPARRSPPAPRVRARRTAGTPTR